MRDTERWSVVFFGSMLCATAALSAVPAGPLAEQRGSNPAVFDSAFPAGKAGNVSANPTVSLINDRSRSAGASAVNARDSQQQASATAAIEEETGASLGLMLASWGLVGLIALRRMFG